MEYKKYAEAVEMLARVMRDYGLSELCVEEGVCKICLSACGHKGASESIPAADSFLHEKGAVPAVIPPTGNIVKSPIVGTFYSAPSPDSSPFVTVGSKVEKGQVICIIESMKLMNEVLSEFSGTVKELYVKNGEAVEFDQKLMLIVNE